MMSDYTPEEDIEKKQLPLLAVIALRHGDCTIQSPIEYSDIVQREILHQGLLLAVKHSVPLIVPRDLETLLENDETEAEILPVKSKTDTKISMKATNKFFRRAADVFTPDSDNDVKAIKNTTEEEQTVEKETVGQVIIVAHNISIGALRRHCNEAGLEPAEVVDLFGEINA